jgi:hypothetical protein
MFGKSCGSLYVKLNYVVGTGSTKIIESFEDSYTASAKNIV